jgi:predicted LPLAT superfamily acyltransferase
MRALGRALPLFGFAPARLLLHPIVAYFFLTDRTARHASLRYLQRLHAMPGGAQALGRPPGLREQYRHMYSFASTALDQAMAWLGSFHRFSVEVEGFGPINDLDDAGQGVILLGAHLGNFGMLRVMAQSRKRPINVLMFRGAAPLFNTMLTEMAPESEVRILEYDPGSPAFILEIKRRIDAGEQVALLADRPPPGRRDGRRVTELPFLGQDAPFPLGPWILASLLKCPVFWVCGLRTGKDRYHLTARPLAGRIDMPRNRRDELLREYVARYAAILEEFCLEQPYQWFNFYDFWQED